MRRFLLRNRWATVLMTGLLLFATSGVAVSRMTCLMGGHSVVSFGASADCCPAEDHEGATLKAECCNFSLAKNDRTELMPGASLLWIATPFLKAAPMWLASTGADVPLITWLEGRPPPGSVPERLAFIGQYRI